MKPVKIYCLVDPRTNIPFYVGATSGNLKVRLSAHKGTDGAKNGMVAKKYSFIKKMQKNGSEPLIKLLRITDYNKADHYEDFYIRKFLRKGYVLLQDTYRCNYQKVVTENSLLKRTKGYWDDPYYKDGLIYWCLD